MTCGCHQGSLSDRNPHLDAAPSRGACGCKQNAKSANSGGARSGGPALQLDPNRRRLLGSEAFQLVGGPDDEVYLADDGTVAVATGLTTIMDGDEDRPIGIGGGLATREAVLPGGMACGDNFRVGRRRFRISRIGPAKCIGADLSRLRNAYLNAHYLIRYAEFELDYLSAQTAATRRHLWAGGSGAGYNVYTPGPGLGRFPDGLFRATSLAYWFGNSSERYFEERLSTVQTTVRNWSKRFDEGFWNNPKKKPVFIRCRKKSTGTCAVEGVVAYHDVRNTIALCPGWQDFSDIALATVVLHEMGHWSTAETIPRDVAVAGVCETNAPDFPDSCYAPPLIDFRTGFYVGGNPRALVEWFESRSDDFSSVEVVRNISNYVCWAVNRWAARGTCILKSVPFA